MSYKRTVRCSYCYGTGHNKSSCPEYKAKIEEYRELGIMTGTVEHTTGRSSVKPQPPRTALAPTVERLAILGLDAPK